MRIKLNSIFVDDQDKALDFYTQVLGFKPSRDIPVGEFRWITLVSPDGPRDVELVLEPNNNPAAQQFQEALLEQVIPITAFEVDDVQAEYHRLTQAGVHFTMEPADLGEVRIAIFSDRCGNLIQIYQGQEY